MLTQIAKASVIAICVINGIGVLVVIGVMVYDQIKYGKDTVHE